MNYFFKTFREGQKPFWILMGFVALWLFALADALKPSSYFEGYLFDLTLVLTIGGAIYWAMMQYRIHYMTLKDKQASEIEAAIFEPQREAEIRRHIRENPSFATMCFECLFFDPELQACSRQFAGRAVDQRVREIHIAEKKYCLYWQRV